MPKTWAKYKRKKNETLKILVNCKIIFLSSRKSYFFLTNKKVSYKIFLPPDVSIHYSSSCTLSINTKYISAWSILCTKNNETNITKTLALSIQKTFSRFITGFILPLPRVHTRLYFYPRKITLHQSRVDSSRYWNVSKWCLDELDVFPFTPSRLVYIDRDMRIFKKKKYGRIRRSTALLEERAWNLRVLFVRRCLYSIELFATRFSPSAISFPLDSNRLERYISFPGVFIVFAPIKISHFRQNW